MRYGKFEVTDKAIGVCSIDYTPVHKDLCVAFGADLFCRKCLQEMLELALANGLVKVPDEQVQGEKEEQEEEQKEEFNCDVCGRTFKSWRAFLAHMRSHRKDDKEPNG